MLAGSPRTQIAIGIVLAILMASTRGYHFVALELLPSASWAVFFLAGLYLRPFWMFPALLAEAAVLDFSAITWGGVSDFCVSPAYGFLLPAYGVLWLAGRWYAGHHHERMTTLFPLAASLCVGAAVCELISSGSFYFFSGRFEQTSMMELASRFLEYFPRSISSVAFYVGITGILHVVFSAATGLAASASRLRTFSWR
jgi:hypothetical protein